jgi:amino acid transporter
MTLDAKSPQNERPGLIRGLGTASAAAIVVGTMIGTGIFLKPSEMAREAGTVSMVFAAWIVGGVLSLFGALCYAELGTSFPEAGGEYVYLRRGLGPSWGFLFGWMHSIVARPASGAAIAAGLLRFCAFLFPVFATPIHVFHFQLPFLGGCQSDFTFSWMQPLAVIALILITYINYLGVRVGGGVQVILTVMKVLSVVLIIVVGFSLAHPQSHEQVASPLWPTSFSWGTLSGFLAALAAAVWAYDGWNNLNLVGSEVQNPERNFPRVIVGGVFVVIGLYLLFNVVCFRALPFDMLRSSEHVASDVFASFAGRSAALWITVAMAISALGTLNSSLLSGARVDYAMARDGIFFQFVAGIHPKYRTPGNALIFQCFMASLMALTGTFEDLTSLVMFGSWIFYGLAVVSMLRMRRTEPNLPRPFRTWGYPAIPIIFIVGAAALALSLWVARPVRSTTGMALILLGLVFYRAWLPKATEPPLG